MASKDYKTPQRHAPARSGHPMLIGIVIGIVLGLAAALGVALYFTKVPGPFVSRDEVSRRADNAPAAKSADPAPAPRAKEGTRAEPQPPQSGDGDAPAAQASGAKAGDKPGDKPRFEFYGILAGSEKPAKDKEVKPPPADPAKPVEHFYLQVGAFPRADDADNLKAKLALAGIEAKIKTAELPDGKIWHRVRVGPFDSVEEVDRVRARLKENQLQGALIKVQEKP